MAVFGVVGVGFGLCYRAGCVACELRLCACVYVRMLVCEVWTCHRMCRCSFVVLFV